ncbi:MAG: hypothetical protein K0S47_213 [Herbinix sp.]|jgi:transporter family-2 protein|nr:hypothetical protein [Herbinix sp.]
MNLFLSLFVGVITSIMILFNGTISNAYGSFTSSIIIHSVGLFAIVILLLVRRIKVSFQPGIPIYYYSAGLIGVFTVVLTNVSYAYLGVSLVLAVGLLGQSVFSIFVDHYGMFGSKIVRFHRKKFLGLAIIAVGIVVMTIY